MCQKLPESARAYSESQRELEKASTKECPGGEHRGLRESQKSWVKHPKMDPKFRDATSFHPKTPGGGN